MKGKVSTRVRRHLDDQIETVRPLAAVARPEHGWINAIRRGLGITEAQLAGRMRVAQPTLHRLERSEANGTIRLDSLRRAAEALDCEVVYALIPRHSLETTVNERARELARAELARVAQSMALEAQDVSVSEDAVEERSREILARGALWRSR